MEGIVIGQWFSQWAKEIVKGITPLYLVLSAVGGLYLRLNHLASTQKNHPKTMGPRLSQFELSWTLPKMVRCKVLFMFVGPM